MKVCIFTHTFPRFAGDTAAPFMGELATAIGSRGADVVVLTPYDKKIKPGQDGRKYRLFSYKYIWPKSLHILGYSRTLKGGSLSFIAYLLSPFLYFFGFWALLNLVRREKVDVISAHWIIPNGFVAALVSKITKVPLTVTIPGSDVYMGGKNCFFRWLVGVAAKNASVVISDSPYYLKQLAELGFYPSKTEIIRYGVNTDIFKPEKNRDKSSQIILGVGRLVAKKGFIYLIKAMPNILKSFPDAKLILVGDGEERENLKLATQKTGIESRALFAGSIPHSKLSEFYHQASVFVMPSIKDESGNIDASPVAMMEAMACGVPVVGTYFSGNKDLVIDGVTGYLVKEKKASEISSAVVKLLSSLEAKQTKKKVREVAVRNFSSRVIAGKYVKSFEELLV